MADAKRSVRPTNPCPWCSGTQFGVIEEARIEIVCDAKIDWGNVLQPGFAIVVCKRCGATQLFSSNLLEQVHHLVVDVAKAGYR